MKKDAISIILGKLKPKDSDESIGQRVQQSSDPKDGNVPDECVSAAEQILQAIEMKDAKLLAQALLDFDEIEDKYSEEY